MPKRPPQEYPFGAPFNWKEMIMPKQSPHENMSGRPADPNENVQWLQGETLATSYSIFLPVFFSVLLAILVSLAILIAICFVYVRPYVDAKQQVFTTSIDAARGTITTEGDKISNSISNFHIFGK